MDQQDLIALHHKTGSLNKWTEKIDRQYRFSLQKIR